MMSHYDENPSQKVLDKIQSFLDIENKEKNYSVGLEDIGMNFPGKYCVVMEGKKPMAVAAIADHGELWKLYVCPEDRGCGIAEKLVLRLIAQATDGLFVEMTPQSFDFWNKIIQKHNLKCEQVYEQPKITLWLN